LYNGVSSAEIGLPKGATLAKAPERPKSQQKPIVFYGTSITQGGCASRPGMVHTAILGRRFERPVINLGFSGNGKMDKEMAALLAELDAAVFVIDCLPNLNAKDVAERTEPLVAAIRQKQPKTPILLVEDRTYSNAAVVPGLQERHKESRAALRKAYDKLTASGDKHLHYLRGDKLLGDDDESTVDGSHPTDLGFLRQADVFADAIAPLLPQPEKRGMLEGYTDQLSYVAGDSIRFHISSGAPKYRLEIARFGTERTVVWSKDDLEGKEHAIPPDASANGCKWPAALSLRVPAEWRSGYYTARLSAPGPDKPVQSELFFVVRSSRPGHDTRILLQLCTNTYNAYCNWGGYS